ncbi:stage II sporulation protein M [Algicella marina]|uniref:Stage II sporulation protein M n=2 Tax=Algicella marina TaxID=2683284 RepID=A0A6P1T3E3_9RHOB|nr:stage II sporulation protein M [Algicella marina]
MQDIRSARFRAEREDDWIRLDGLVTRVEKRGLSNLSFDEARELASLYRNTVNALSLAREISLDRALHAYLEALAARAYLAVYAPKKALGGMLWQLFSRGIPQAVRRSGFVLVMAFATMILGGVAGYLLFLEDPTWFNTIVPGGLAGERGILSSRDELEAVLTSGADGSLDRFSAFASYLFSHNTQIALFTFALGVVICVPSTLLTFYNGLVIGAFAALHADRGLAYELFAWLSVHGVTELSAIAIACAGGFHLGLAVLFPGQMTRRDALRHAGYDAVKLAILAAAMLVVAAVLEGFFRQIIQTPETRILVGWGIGGLWLAYFLFSGRGEDKS